MKKITAGALILSTLSLFSCQREIDFNTPNSGGSNGTRLVKITQQQGSDLVTINYTYDGSGRLIEEKITGVLSGIDAGNDLRIQRNGAGVITKTIQKSALLAANGLDSSVTIFHYDAATSHYTSRVMEITFFGITTSDSTVFTYNGGGRIIKSEVYEAFMGFPYDLFLKIDYTYTPDGNIDTEKQSAYDAGTSTFDLVLSLTYQYDTKVNPLILGTEGVVLDKPTTYGNNNSTKSEYADETDPANDFAQTITYVYNSSNRPLTAINKETPSNTIQNLAWFYQ